MTLSHFTSQLALRHNMGIFRIFIVVVSIAVALADYYHSNWCGGSLQYLDDRDCVKVFPSSYDREWKCPIEYSGSIPTGYYEDGPLNIAHVDTATLGKYVTSGANLCMILTKRVKQTNGEIKLYNKYMCAGNMSSSEIWETWSSSKIFAMANAAGHLRAEESSCAKSTFGIDSTTTGKQGTTQLGDLATIICSYDHTAGYSSNSLSSYFHDMGWRDRIAALVAGDWINLQDQHLTLGGNYGEATPSDLSLTLKSATAPTTSCAADKDPWPKKYDNSLSALAAAEMTRRIALHREVQPELVFPGSTWVDMQNILYGAKSSTLFPGQTWGGMSSDTAIFLQSALNMTDVEASSSGLWRIFSKLGAGYSSSRYRGEIVNNAYACLPSLGSSGGFEFTISVRGSIPNDGSLLKAQKQVYDGFQQAISALLAGSLE